jgi:hypothetical protein
MLSECSFVGYGDFATEDSRASAKEKKNLFSGEETSVETKGARFEAGGQHTRKNQLVSCDVG